MKKILILLIISVLTSCQVSNTSQSKDIKSKITLSLLDRLRSLPGLRISGFDERNAEIYLRGQTSVKYYKEVLFFVNGNRVGNYSSAYQLLQPDNIDSIKLLKSSSELNVYGAEGRDGVILIKTKN